MLSPKQITQARRGVLLAAPCIALGYFLLLRVIVNAISSSDNKLGTTSPQNRTVTGADFGSLPKVLRGFWPFDLVATALWAYALGMLGVLMAIVISKRSTDEVKPFSFTGMQVGAIGAVMCGAFCAGMDSIINGWFAGLIMFPFGAVFVPLSILIILVVFKIMEFLIDRLLFGGLAAAGTYIGAHLKPTWVGRATARVQSYANADDVAAESSKVSSTH